MLKKLLLLVTSLFLTAIVLVLLLFAYIQFADLNRYKPQISQRLSQYLGRSVIVDGGLDVTIIPRPGLSLYDAKIANAQWGSAPNMLAVRKFDLQLAMLPLFSGELVISKFILDDVQIVVEHNQLGENNWQFFQPKQPPAKTSSARLTLPLDFDPGVEVDIANINLAYSEAPSAALRNISLDKAMIIGITENNVLQIEVSGQVDNHIYKLEGQVGDMRKLLAPDEIYPVDMRMHALNTDVQIKGEFYNLLKLQRMQLSVTANTKDLTAWQPWLGVKIDNSPVKFSADIDGNLEKLSVTNLVAQMGNAKANGNLMLDMSAYKPVLRAQLKVMDIHIEELVDSIHAIPAEKSASAQPVARADPPGDELDLGFLNQFDSKISVAVGPVTYQDWKVDQFDAELAVIDGRLSLAPFSIASNIGQAKGNFSLYGDKGVNIAKLDIDAQDLALGKFYDVASPYQGMGALQGSIYSKGKSLSALYANLQGNATAHYVNKEHKHHTKIFLKRPNPGSSSTPFDVIINGELQNVPYKINGEIGGPMALISDKPYPATARLQFLNVDVKAKGSIAKLFEAKGFNIDIDALTEDLAKLNKKLDIGLPSLKKAQLLTVMRGDYSLLKFDSIDAQSKNMRLSGNVSMDFSAQLPGIGGEVIIHKFELAGMQQEIARAEKNETRKSASDQSSALTDTVSFAAIKDFNMNIKLSAGTNGAINIPRFPVSKLSAQLLVENGVFSVSPLVLDSPHGRINSDLAIDASNKTPSIEARVHSRDFDLESFGFNDEEPMFWEAIAGVDISLHAQGSSPRHWLESVAGTANLNYRHKQLAQTFAVRLSRETQAYMDAVPVLVRINSMLRGTIAHGSGSISAPQTWLSHGQPTELEFSANAKGFVGVVKGKIDDVISGDGMELLVSLANEPALTASLGQNAFANRVGKVQIASRIKGNYSSVVASELNGVIGEGRVSGSTSMNFTAQPLAVDVYLDINGLDISKWAEDSATVNTANTIKTKQNKGAKLFSTEKLPFDLLKFANIKGTVKGTDFQFKRLKAQDFHTTVNLRDGVFQLIVNRLQATNGVLYADLDINANTEQPQVSLKLDVPKLNVSELARNTAAEGLINGNFSSDISITSSGSSVAELMAHLDGHVRLLMDEGSIDSALLNVYVGGLHAMLGMMTATNVKTTKVNCGICGLKFNNGKGTTEVVLLDTQHSTLVAEGWVDFSDETFELKASPVGKGVSLNVEVPVLMQGSITNPKFSAQSTAALYKAAEIATVWLIPTTAIFIAYDGLRSGEKNPCVNMVSPTKDRAGMRAIKGAGKAVEDIGSGFNRALSRMLGGQGDLAEQGENAADE